MISTVVDLLAEPERDRQVAQVELERLDDLGVAEVEHRGPLLDDGDPRAEGGEHRRVLDADHAGADDDHRAGHALQREDAVGVEDVLSSNSTAAGRAGLVPVAMTIVLRGDGVVVAAPLAVDGDGVRVHEARGAAERCRRGCAAAGCG